MNNLNKEKNCSLANTCSCFKDNNIQTKILEEKFILSFPDKEKYFFNVENDILFDNKTYKDLTAEMGIPDFEELINKHKLIVAKQFINLKNNGYMIFNGEKLGIRRIFINKTDKKENCIFKIEFYRTDCYTHEVMKSIYRELMKRNNKTMDFACIEDVVKYYPFITSLKLMHYLLSIATPLKECGFQNQENL